ncbi:MAG: hypothetical protein RL152_535 [Bacteroidota bacterium]|jgi:hypothetical protein
MYLSEEEPQKVDNMFLTKDDLKLSYGVELTIGKAYVDRAVPKDNLYWKGRTIYVPGASGYIFMPIYADLLRRSGATVSFLLSEAYFSINESILHSAALLEHQKIDWPTHVQECISMVAPHVTRIKLFEELKQYLLAQKPVKSNESRLGTDFPSLNRADSYLLSLACIPDETFDEQKALDGWYAMITYFLLMDDLADIRDDLLSGEENAIIEAGLNRDGIDKIERMMNAGIDKLNLINPVLSNRIEHKKSLIDIPQLVESIRRSL